MLTMTEMKIVKMRCNAKNRPQSMNICVLHRFVMCKLVLFDINAVILFQVHQVLHLFVLKVFAPRFTCTCISIHILSFKNVDTVNYSWSVD